MQENSIYSKECPLILSKGTLELIMKKRPDLSVYADMLIAEGVIIEEEV